EGGEGPRTATQIASDLAVEVLSALCDDPDDTPAPWTTTDTDTTDVGADAVTPDAGAEDDGASPDADDVNAGADSDVSDAAGSPDRIDTGADPPGTGDADPSNAASARGAPPPSVRGLTGDVDRVLSRVRAVVQVTVAATTLAGLDDEPGFLAGYGPIDADTARKLAERVKWCV
ncbi:hypothetical protein ACWXWW_17845, partial [Microbacterium sp. KNMS]